MAQDPGTYTYAEGVGDEVVLSITTFLAVVVMTAAAWLYTRNQHRPAAIHPDHERVVNEARRHLGVGPDAGGEQARGAGDQPFVQHANRNDPCPICLTQTSFAVSTNCGHMFCAVCLLEFYRRSQNFPSAIKCPTCRQQVTILLPDFTNEERADPELLQISGQIHDYNRRNSGAPRSFMEIVQDVPALFTYICRNLFAPDGLHLVFRIRLVIMVTAMSLYLLSPLDIIPEAVFGLFGLIDDLLIVLIMVLMATLVAREHVIAQAAEAHVGD